MYEADREPMTNDNGSYPHPSELTVETVEHQEQVARTARPLGKSGLAPVVEWGPSQDSYRSERLGGKSQL